MSTQRIHFLKVIGRLATEVEGACEAIRRRKPQRSADGRSGHDWHSRDRQRIDHLGLALRSAAGALPILWHSCYVDGYSWGWSAESYGGWHDGVQRSIYSLNTGIAYFPQAVLAETLAHLKRGRRRTVFDHHLRMAIEEMAWAKGNALVVVVSECLGGSWLDDDVHASAKATLHPLLAATRNQLPDRTDGRSAAGLSRRLRNLAMRLQEDN